MKSRWCSGMRPKRLPDPVGACRGASAPRDMLPGGRFTRRQICRLGAMAGLSLWGLGGLFAWRDSAAEGAPERGALLELKAPDFNGNLTLEEAIGRRRCIRSFKPVPITDRELSQILWSAQGITDPGGRKRAAPSGGALYPADLYAAVGKGGVQGLEAGVYHYRPQGHRLSRVGAEDRRREIASASFRQMWMADAPVLFIITLEYARITGKYGERGVRYALIEAGHIGQNIFLQCQSLGLAAGIVGAFDDREVAAAAGAARNHEPVIVMPVGRPS